MNFPSSAAGKITFTQAETIRGRRAAGERTETLAGEFAISPQMVRRIVRRANHRPRLVVEMSSSAFEALRMRSELLGVQPTVLAAALLETALAGRDEG